MRKLHFVVVRWKELWHNLVQTIMIHCGMMMVVMLMVTMMMIVVISTA